MGPYTEEGVTAAQAAPAPPAAGSGDARRQTGRQSAQKPPPTMYELVGVVVHSGQASAGHYYSYVKDRR